MTMRNSSTSLSSGPRGGHILLWSLMTVMATSAAVLTRFCGVPASSIGFWRTAGAALVLLPWWISEFGRTRPRVLATPGAVLTGSLLGIHFATWAWALLHSHLANAALFISLQPAVTPLFGLWINRDRLNRTEIAGTILACAGMLWILGGQVLFTPDQLPGSLVALFSMVCCALYFVMGRKFRASEHVILFSVPVYMTAGLVQAAAALIVDHGISWGAAPQNWAALAAIILIPTAGGHTLSMFLLRHLKAHTIALSIPVQFVFITVLGIAIFGEWPRPWFYPGALVVISGVILAIVSSAPRKPNVRAG